MSIYTVKWYTASGLRIQHQSLVATPQCGCNRLLLRKLDDVSHRNRQSKTERSQCAYYSLQNVGTKIRLGRIGVAHK